MKNISILLGFTCLIFFTAPVQAQNNTKKHSIGIQFNPYLDSYFFDGVYTKWVFAIRYGFNINDHLSFGPEVSGYYMHHSITKYSDFNLGGFVRYTLLPTSRIRPFLEFSPYYSIYHFKINTTQTWEGVDTDYGKTYISGYLSPGISLYTKNRKFSLDLMYKFSISNKNFVNGNKSAFSYRFNFNF
jgi:hypothetical protein